MSTKETNKSYVKEPKGNKKKAKAEKKAVNKKEKKSSGKKTGKIIGILLLLLLAVYGGITFYFTNHFYYGTTINGFLCQFKTVEEAKELMKEYTKGYSLTLKERHGKEETITSDHINFHYVDNGMIEKWMEEQISYEWPRAFWEKYEYTDRESFVYEEEKLTKTIDGLTCFAKEQVTKPVRAYPSYNEEKKVYEIIPEVEGNQVIKKTLTKTVKECIAKGNETLDLDEAECYKKPAWYKDDKEVIEANNLMNKYVSAKVTYDMGFKKELLDADKLHEWISVDKNNKVTLDTKKVADYVLSLAYRYNTVGKARSFTTPGGQNITVSGGTYGWRINQDQTKTKLIKLIKAGKTEALKPVYSQTGLKRDSSGDDLHNTYIAISIASQHMWFYKNGTCLIDTPVVTGDAAKNMHTPRGVYSVAWKQRDKVLRGEDYETPVSYWLPFITYRGIGIHDADWRASFGKDIYKTNGSHGCVNTPRNAVSYIYENVSTGTPVVVY